MNKLKEEDYKHQMEKKKESGDIFEKEEISHKNEDSNAALD